MRSTRLLRTVSASIVFALTALAGANGAHADQLGTFPIDTTQLKTWNDQNIVHIKDATNGEEWLFFNWTDGGNYLKLLTTLGSSPAGNLTQFAFVGVLNGGNGAVSHDSWVVPLAANGKPSVFGPAPDGARSFNSGSLMINWSDAGHDYVLTDGKVKVGEAIDQAPLNMLKQMIVKYGVSTVWQVPDSNWTQSPVGNGGRLDMYLIVGPAMGGTGSNSGTTPGSSPMYNLPGSGLLPGKFVCNNVNCICPAGQHKVNGHCVPCAMGPTGKGLAGASPECTPTTNSSGVVPSKQN